MWPKGMCSSSNSPKEEMDVDATGFFLPVAGADADNTVVTLDQRWEPHVKGHWTTLGGLNHLPLDFAASENKLVEGTVFWSCFSPEA